VAAIAHAFVVEEIEHAVVYHEDDAALVYYQQKEMTKRTMTMMMSCSQVKIALKKKKIKKIKIKTVVVHVGFAVYVIQAKPLPCGQVSVGLSCKVNCDPESSRLRRFLTCGGGGD
jgi:hypothetical protein